MRSTPQMTQEYEEAAQEICSLLVFRLGEQAFALNIETVIQVIPMLRLTPVPQLNRMIEGIANIHGTMVPVISARRHLSLPEMKLELYTPIILAMVEERPIGWIVDEVTEIISVPAESIIAPDDILPEGMENAPVMSGLIYQQNYSAIVLDPRYILRPAEFRMIDQVFDTGTQFNTTFPLPGTNEAAEPRQAARPDQLAIETVCAALAQKLVEPHPANQQEDLPPAPAELEVPFITAIVTPDCSPIPEPESLAVDTSNPREGESAVKAFPEITAEVPETKSSSNGDTAHVPNNGKPPAEVPAKGRKTGKRGSRKGKIIPNTGKSPQAQAQKARRSIQSVLAGQFAALAKDILETDNQASIESAVESDRSGE